MIANFISCVNRKLGSLIFLLSKSFWQILTFLFLEYRKLTTFVLLLGTRRKRKVKISSKILARYCSRDIALFYASKKKSKFPQK